MLYILDIKNYQKDIDIFREDFLKCGQKKGYDITPDLKEFLGKLGIDSDRIDFNCESKLCFNKGYKNIFGNIFYGRHHMVGYDDIYNTINFYKNYSL